jgi:hypothetical protein
MTDTYQIDVVAPSRRKYPTKLRTCQWNPSAQRWVVGDISAYLSKNNIHAGNLPGGLLRKPFLSGHKNMNMVSISDKCKVQYAVLSTICDALRQGGLHTISVDEVNVINSQYGSYIAKLETLTGDERRHATPALHSLILSAVLP